MDEERIPTLLPGDPITYLVRFGCQANIESITAVFVNEETGSEIRLHGIQGDNRQQRMRGGRIQTVALNLAEDSPPPQVGRYRLAHLQAMTYGGKPLDFDNPPEDAFLYSEESDDLPRIIDHIHRPHVYAPTGASEPAPRNGQRLAERLAAQAPL